MSADEIAFVEEIRRAPDDLTPRLIYADYLEDEGNPRGELIRIQCQLSQTVTGDPSRPELFNRERELLDEFGEQWLEPVRSLGVQNVSRGSFQNGLLERARINVEDLVANGSQLIELMPALRCLDLRNPAANINELTAFDMPPQIQELELAACQFEADKLEQLGAATWAAGIESLNLQMNSLNDQGFAALASGNWQNLKRLKMGINRMTAGGIRAVSDLPFLSILEELDLRMNEIGNQGLGRLAGCKMPELRVLNLVRCEIQTIRVLIDRDRWPKLTHLFLRNNPLSNDEIQVFRSTSMGQRLTEFDVRG